MSSARVWVDILTPKQVLFFAPLVELMENEGCEVLATSRVYREIEPMARMCRLDLTYVGERGGEDLAGQLAAATERQARIIPLVREFRPGAAVSVASGVCARVAFGLRFGHVAVNDSPHSEVAGRLSLPLSHHLLCPWIIPYDAWKRFGLTRRQITRYHALDPAAWLKRPPLDGPVPRLKRGQKTITVRLEESYAPYMIGSNRDLPSLVLGRLAKEFPDGNLVALCRYGGQIDHVRKGFPQFIVPEGVVDGRRLLMMTDVFVGMGGTMSAEAALVGVPTISAFQGVLQTETYLKSMGLLTKTSDPREIARRASEMTTGRLKNTTERKARRLLDSMEDPIPRVAEVVMKLARLDRPGQLAS